MILLYSLWCKGLTKACVYGYVTVTSDSYDFTVFTNAEDPSIFLVGAWLLLLEKVLVSLRERKTG